MDDLIREHFEEKDGILFCIKQYHNKVRVGDPVGHDNGGGYLRMKFNKKRFLVHKVIYFLHTGKWPERVDHEDRNTLNNDFSNLREATSSQNNRNRKSKTGASSQFLGVSKFRNKWKTQISIENKTKTIGIFTDETVAAKAYDEAAKKVAGLFANLNFKETS